MGAPAKDSQRTFSLAVAALGVVFGDIGTSPLYALRESFTHSQVPLTSNNILGILSLIFWTLVLIICVKYVLVVLRANNKGEGGILSLLALVLQQPKAPRRWLFTIGIFGAALLYGDGLITPAISVLSAVEGLKILTPSFEPIVVPVTMGLIVCLFLGQRYGTGRIGLIFGPVIFLWFLVIGLLGAAKIAENPAVLMAVSPTYAVNFFLAQHQLALLVLGSVFLVATGGEALYADMGHFGDRPIRWAWFLVAMPGLLLNYFGQGALLLQRPEAIENPFYLLSPPWALGGLVVLSTVATVIASQALISGVFSITRQAVQLGLCPRLPIVHTSRQEIGQIYIPLVNWALMVGVCWLVFAFKSSSSLAAAYGIAVTGTMVITTLLAYEVARWGWGWKSWQALSVFGVFLLIDLAFFVSNIIKIEHGGWVPLVIAVVVYLLMTTWKKGRRILADSLAKRSMPIQEFISNLGQLSAVRVPGSAIYMSGDPGGTPVPLLHNLKHNKVLHSQIALLTIKTVEVPTVDKESRVKVEELAPKFYRIQAQYGFMETPKIKHILEALRMQGILFSLSDTTFVLGRETILPSGEAPLPLWQEKLFAWMSRNAERPTTFFKIPPNQVIEVGIQVEI